MPLELVFLNPLLDGELVEIEMLDLVEGIPVLEIKAPAEMEGAAFNSFEDIVAWLMGDKEQWQNAPAQDTLGRFALASRWGGVGPCDLRHALAVFKLHRTTVGRHRAASAKAPLTHRSGCGFYEESINSLHVKGSETVRMQLAGTEPSEDLDSLFAAEATRLVARQLVAHRVERERAPLASAVQSPVSSYDFFVRRSLEEADVLRVKSESPQVAGAYSEAWVHKTDEEVADFEIDYQQKCGIPTACGAQELLMALEAWYAAGGTTDPKLPREGSIPKCACIEWHYLAWKEVILWAHKRPWREEDFEKQLDAWYERIQRATLDDTWSPK